MPVHLLLMLVPQKPPNDNAHASSAASLAHGSVSTATALVSTSEEHAPAMSQELGGSNAAALPQTAEHQPVMGAQAAW